MKTWMKVDFKKSREHLTRFEKTFQDLSKSLEKLVETTKGTDVIVYD